MAKPRVHEIAADFGLDSKVVLAKLRELGEFVKSPSSAMQPPVARKVRAALKADGYEQFARLEPDAEVVPMLRELPRSMPDLVGSLATGAHPFATALASARGALYYVGTSASQLIGSLSGDDRESAGLRSESMHSPRGIMLLQHSPRRVTLFAWASEEAGIAIQSGDLTVGAHDGLPRLRYRPLTVRRAGDFLMSGTKDFATFAAAWQVVPTQARAESTRPTEKRPGNTPRTGAESTVGIQLVRLVRDGRRERSDRPVDPTRHATSRWTVRGHWREQPYPSTGETRRIWIEEHSAGVDGGLPAERTRIYIIAPRANSEAALQSGPIGRDSSKHDRR